MSFARLSVNLVVASLALHFKMTFADLVTLIVNLIKPLLAVLVGIALLVFFKGLIAFIAKSGDAKTHTDGRNLMIWGVIALFVMISFVGIIRLFYSDLGFDTRPFGIPYLPGGKSP